LLFKGYGAKVGLGNMRVKAENRMLTIDILVFILIVFLSMSDSKSPEIASILLFLLQHILSLPLSLLNDNLPFYLEYREFPNFIFISLPANISKLPILGYPLLDGRQQAPV